MNGEGRMKSHPLLIFTTIALMSMINAGCSPQGTLTPTEDQALEASHTVEVASPTLTPTSTHTPTSIPPTPTATIEPYREKLTEVFKQRTEEIFGETQLQEVNGQWSLVNEKGEQAAIYLPEYENWYINYPLRGPRTLPGWNREDYLCQIDNPENCNIDIKEFAQEPIVEYGFPSDFGNNPLVKKEIEFIENWLTEEMRVPLGKIPHPNDANQYFEIYLSLIALGKNENFRWITQPTQKYYYSDRYEYLWLGKIDNNGRLNNSGGTYYARINEMGEAEYYRNVNLKTILSGIPVYDPGFKKENGNYVWTTPTAIGLYIPTADQEWFATAKTTVIPINGTKDIMMVNTETFWNEDGKRRVYEFFDPRKGNIILRGIPLAK